MNENDKIQLDDITFDDVIGGEGLEIKKPEAIDTADDTKTAEELEAAELEADAASTQKIADDEAATAAALLLDKDDDNDDDDDEGDDDDGETTVVSEVLTALGYELDEDFDDTSEGLVKMTKAVADKMADSRLDEVLENFPLVKRHLEYVLAGGESDNFMDAYDTRSDYTKMALSEDDSRSQKEILASYFKAKGHDKEFTDEMIEDYEDSGKLFDKADKARQALGKQQDANKSQLVDRQREASAAEAKDQETFWSGVSETIENSQEFKGIVVPDKEKAKFFKYISSPINKNGQTQRDVDHGTAEMDTKLAMDYLMYKGFNLETIINTKAKTKSAQTLRSKIEKGGKGVKSARRADKNKKVVDYDDLNLEI